MPALVLIGYWALFTGLIFLALQYLPRKPASCVVALLDLLSQLWLLHVGSRRIQGLSYPLCQGSVARALQRLATG
jgi:hypothetical protein